MLLYTTPLEELNLQRIRELIDNQVCEDRHLEYKRELPGNTSGDKKEFLADVTAMANSGGGDIIYGIEEKKENDEKPYSIKPISGQDADEVKQRLDSLLRNGIQPRLINYQLKEIKIENKSFLIILRIPRTLHTPYMVAYKGSQKFYTRNS